jgi:FMN phosphatase YigB (HAD superfamily)
MALTVATNLAVETVDWSQLDTILLDMDGTLLDLEFDNHFWGTVIPERWGQERGPEVRWIGTALIIGARSYHSISPPSKRAIARAFVGDPKPRRF